MLRERQQARNGSSRPVGGAAATNAHQDSRFELLPLGRSEEEAAQLPEPVRLTVICSPKHGPDRTVEVAGRLTDLGHRVTAHVAARMVRGRDHLDELLAKMAQADVDDLFLIGGDAKAPHGPYSSAEELLPILAAHRQRPRKIGVGGYPEGHPLIDDSRLVESLQQKSRLADYVTTQLCFDAGAILRWLADTRQRGITLPAIIGMPGVVDRARLLKVSMQIGVGPSRSFLRKQRGIRNLIGHSHVTPDRVYDGLASSLGDPELNIAGFHYYTFNQLVATWNWERERHGAPALAATP
jgi:methylenetetrahydrofolate reductase (NADPH)